MKSFGLKKKFGPSPKSLQSWVFAMDASEAKAKSGVIWGDHD